jgi:hypothetical protein
VKPEVIQSQEQNSCVNDYLILLSTLHGRQYRMTGLQATNIMPAINTLPYIPKASLQALETVYNTTRNL